MRLSISFGRGGSGGLGGEGLVLVLDGFGGSGGSLGENYREAGNQGAEDQNADQGYQFSL